MKSSPEQSFANNTQKNPTFAAKKEEAKPEKKESVSEPAQKKEPVGEPT